jgi:hypothetical protein
MGLTGGYAAFNVTKPCNSSYAKIGIQQAWAWGQSPPSNIVLGTGSGHAVQQTLRAFNFRHVTR